MISDLMRRLAEPVVEVRQPRPGVRHQVGERLVWHRFPVRDGIRPADAMARTIFAPSPALMALLRGARNA